MEEYKPFISGPGKIKLEKGKKPYVKKFCSIAGFDVWLVDGEYIRKNICEDFVNCDEHYHLKFIPKNEFWIDKRARRGEDVFFIDHLLAENRLMARGMNFEDAYDKAAVVEQHERDKSRLAKKLKKVRKNEALLDKIRKRLIKKYTDKIKIWLVNGEAVRDLFSIGFGLTGFGGGGHDRVYNFIPNNEIWIDEQISPKERKFIIVHELHERNLMAKGMKYYPAHRRATEIEDYCRKNPEKTDGKIKEEMKKQKIFG